MTRVSADLTPELWGGLDRWAEAHGTTRAQAVVEAVARLVDAHDGALTGSARLGDTAPLLAAVLSDLPTLCDVRTPCCGSTACFNAGKRATP